MVSRRTPPANSRNTRNALPGSRVLPALAIIGLCCFTYANSLHGKFVFDDQTIIFGNPQMLNIGTVGGALAMGAGWRQLLFATYGLNYYWGGLDTFGYHLINTALHICNALLVYAILVTTLKSLEGTKHARFAALAGASVFGVHTLLSSAVSYIAGRSSVLCATFYFAAILLFFIASDENRRSLKITYFLLAAASGLIAFQAKQEAITLPLFLAASVLLRSETKRWRWIALLGGLPAIAVLLMRRELATLYETVYRNQDLVAGGFERALLPVVYFRTYLTAVAGYFLPRFVVPVRLSADPYAAPVDHWYSPAFVFSAALLLSLVWLAIRVSGRQPLLAFGIAALLVSPLMAYAAIPLADVVFEHRAYIPGLGVGFLFGWLFQWLAQKYPRVRWPALAAVVLIFAFMTAGRNRVFADNIALWEDAEAKAPQKPRPHFNLGQAYQEARRFDEAIREYEHALALRPGIHAAYSNMGAIYLDQGQPDKAEAMLLRVTSMAPEFTEPFINLAVLYLRRQETDKALAAINRALESDPQSFAAHFNKGEALTQKKDYLAAVESYKEAARLRPDIVSYQIALGRAYSRTGDLDQALGYFERAIRSGNASPELHHDLGVVYLKKQMLNEAVEHFRITVQQQPDYGPGVLNLALANQLKGDVASARATLTEFLDRFGNSNSPYVSEARQRLGQLDRGKR